MSATVTPPGADEVGDVAVSSALATDVTGPAEAICVAVPPGDTADPDAAAWLEQITRPFAPQPRRLPSGKRDVGLERHNISRPEGLGTRRCPDYVGDAA